MTNLALEAVSSREITAAQLDEVIALCSAVFEMDYAYYMNLGLDRVHILGHAEGRLVTHALWLDRRMWVGALDRPPLRAAYVEGVCTHPGYRRRGYGAALMRRLQEEIARAGYELGALSPAREEWYERLGWTRWQGPLFINHDGAVQATPDDHVVVYRLPRSGDLDVSQPLIGEWRCFELW